MKFDVGTRIRHIRSADIYEIIIAHSCLMRIPQGEWVPAYIYERNGQVFAQVQSDVEEKFELEEVT